MAKRYIDAERIDFSPLIDDFDRARAKVIIMGQPTADVVEVVRCKKCKYRTTHTCAITGIKTLFCDYDEKPVVVEPTHYCGYGKRRTDDEEMRI